LGVHEAQLLGGRYRLVERLGEGGMSLVWRGHDEVLGRDVAVKMLTPRFAEDETVGERMRVEAQAVARLCHPHITAVYDYGESITASGRTVPYVVMELVYGEPLSARLADGGMPWTDAVTTCAQVASALATAHAHGIVHRDVTPSNVMLTRGGAKVVDFGISALAGERDACPDGSLFGTPAYLAPERLDGGPVEPATDVYALGVLLYKALAGRLPWPTMNTTQMLRAHRLAEPAPLPSSVTAEVPPEVVRLCRRCLAKRPQDRPASDEAAQTLAAAVHLVVPLPADEQTVARPMVGPAEQTTLSWQIEGQSDADGSITEQAESDGAVGSQTEVEGTGEAEPDVESDSGKLRRRSAAVVLGAIVLLTAAAWAGVRSPAVNLGGDTSRAGAAPADEQRCRVDYQVSEDWGSGFKANVAVTNQGTAALRDWQLAFAFASDQRVTAAHAATWNQTGRTVVTRPARPASRLDPGASAEIGLTGRYVRGNPLPAAFDLDGSPCQTVVVKSAPPPTPTPLPAPEKPGNVKHKDGKAKGKHA
jgi:eukaryotic-like serine/threonine-protein kinase